MSFLKPAKKATGWARSKPKAGTVQRRASSNAYWERHAQLYPDAPQWEDMRRKSYAAYGGKCVCGAHLKGALFPEGVAWQLDHRRELSGGGKNVVQNMRPLCLPCHRKKTLRNRRGD